MNACVLSLYVASMKIEPDRSNKNILTEVQDVNKCLDRSNDLFHFTQHITINYSNKLPMNKLNVTPV